MNSEQFWCYHWPQTGSLMLTVDKPLGSLGHGFSLVVMVVLKIG